MRGTEKPTCCSKLAFDMEVGVTKTCSITGSVCNADLPSPELSVGTERHPRTVCPSDSATFKYDKQNFQETILRISRHDHGK